MIELSQDELDMVSGAGWWTVVDRIVTGVQAIAYTYAGAVALTSQEFKDWSADYYSNYGFSNY